MANEISISLSNIQEDVKDNKEENISLRNEFSKNLNNEDSKINKIVEELKSKQDILKISIDTLEKHILEKVKSMILSEVRMICKDKEEEIVMTLWIDELKKIINDFDKLKELNPKDLKIQLNEISKVINSFKQKLT